MSKEVRMGASEPGQAIQLFEKFFSSGDLDGLMSLYEPEAVFVSGPGQVASGIDAIREALSGFLATGGTLTFRASAVFPAGDVALTHNEWVLEGKDEQDQPVRMEGTTAEVVRRQPDGTWKYVLDNPWGGGVLQGS